MPTFALLIWLPAIALGTYATVDGEYRGRNWQLYVCKPLTTVLIALGALLMDGGVYRWLILAGLAFSLAGDIFLMLPRDRFLPGLASFLVAHLFYIAAFSQGLNWAWPPLWTVAVLAAVWAASMLILLPGARGQRLPVAVYVLVILLMVAAAFARAGLPGNLAWFAIAGALLFALSDTVIGINRFVRPFRAAEGIILGTYFPAQALIVLSIPAAV